MSTFWCELLEFLYMPIYSLIGYDSLLTGIVLVLFVWLQFYVIKICIVKPLISLSKMLLNMFYGGFNDDKD